MTYREESGEKIDGDSWLMRKLWNTKEGHYHHGTIKEADKLKSSGVKKVNRRRIMDTRNSKEG